jgi:hypothetical protein
MRQNAGFRSWAALWSVLQFVLPAIATFADAQLERESARAPGVHVEASSSAACRPSHPDECALCQLLSRAAPPAHCTSLPEIAVVVRPALASSLDSIGSRDHTRVELPRAPPTSA